VTVTVLTVTVLAATHGFGAVHAPNLLAAGVDDLIILAIAPIDAP
jgi:hypothetical protein